MRFRCPKHGDQGNMIGIQLQVQYLPELKKPDRSARICMECWLDHLLKDCHELEVIEPAGTEQ